MTAPDSRTRTGQLILAYLKAHPETTSPTEVSKATGAHRDTCRDYIRAFQEARKTGAEAAPKPAPVMPVPPPVDASVPAPAAAKGRDFTADFPPRKAAPKPAPAPAEPVKEEAQEAPQDDGVEWWTI